MVVGKVVGHPQGTGIGDCRMQSGWGQKAGVGAGQFDFDAVIVIVGQEGLDGV